MSQNFNTWPLRNFSQSVTLKFHTSFIFKLCFLKKQMIGIFIYLLTFLFYMMDMDVLSVCMPGYHVSVVPTEARESLRSPGTGVSASCE